MTIEPEADADCTMLVPVHVEPPLLINEPPPPPAAKPHPPPPPLYPPPPGVQLPDATPTPPNAAVLILKLVKRDIIP
jgi:hypothetical protein